MQFHSGAQVTYCASWDVWQHGHSNMELYGRGGTLHVPDPNFFGGEIRMTAKESFVTVSEDWKHPFSVANDGSHANYRAAGLADMGLAILQNRPHRCSLEFSLHVVDVMTSILASGETGRYKDILTTCDRPEALGPQAAQDLLA
jgi:predicted dehydrogenase